MHKQSKRPSRSRWPTLFQFLCEMQANGSHFWAYFFFLAVFFAAFFLVAMVVASFLERSPLKVLLGPNYWSCPIPWRTSSLDTRYCGVMANVVKKNSCYASIRLRLRRRADGNSNSTSGRDCRKRRSLPINVSRSADQSISQKESVPIVATCQNETFISIETRKLLSQKDR